MLCKREYNDSLIELFVNGRSWKGTLYSYIQLNTWIIFIHKKHITYAILKIKPIDFNFWVFLD